MKNKPNRKTNKPAGPQTLVPLREQIEMRAYEIWIANGGGHGRDVEYWLQAETEILNGTKPPMQTGCIEVEDLMMSNAPGHSIESNLFRMLASGVPVAVKPQSASPLRKK